MTDTRTDFETWALSDEGSYHKSELRKSAEGEYALPATRIASESWQACQSLNDNRIQQLLAVIEKKDEALMLQSSHIEMYSLQISHANDYAKITKAIDLKPEDVELVEVGEADFDKPAGTVNLDIYNIDFDGMHKLYTIKTKEPK